MVLVISTKLTIKYKARLSGQREEVMKKNQYAISIVMGILMGAMIALLIGNTTTAILAGVVSAGFTAWVGSLQWSKAKEFAIDMSIAGKMDIANNIRNVKSAIDWMKNIIPVVGRTMKWILLAISKLAIALATDVNARKRFLAGLAILAIFIFNVYLIRFLGASGEVASTIGLLLLIPMVLPTMASLAVFIRICTASEFQIKRLDADCYYFLFFLFGWFYQIMEDTRGAVSAIVWMLYIRTGNALKILTYPFIFAIWGMVALANNKTGASALAAMILSGMHLTIAHLAGGINTANANFWLSLVVAMGLGVAVGRKVSSMREPAAHQWPLPSIKLRDQVEFHLP